MDVVEEQPHMKDNDSKVQFLVRMCCKIINYNIRKVQYRIRFTSIEIVPVCWRKF